MRSLNDFGSDGIPGECDDTGLYCQVSFSPGACHPLSEGGYDDWRMPTLEEAESLYDEDHVIRDMDRMDIFISEAFSPGGGFTSWTSNELPHATAAIRPYIRFAKGRKN